MRAWLSLFLISLSAWFVACEADLTDIGIAGNRPSDPADASLSKAITEKFTANGLPQIDLLFIIDNSGSMGEEIAFVQDNLEGFVQALQSRKTVDYQLAITDTDNLNHHGRLIQSADGRSVIRSRDNINHLSEIHSMLQKIADAVPGNRVWELGLASMEDTLAIYGTAIMRPQTPLAIMILSDEDDQSWRKDPWNSSAEHYRDYLAGLKRDVYLYPVVGLDSNQCPEVFQEGVFQGGYTYVKVQGLTGKGRSSSICEADITESVLSIGRDIAERTVCFALKALADPSSVKVSVNGVASMDFEYVQEKQSVCFDEGRYPAANTTVEVTYSLK